MISNTNGNGYKQKFNPDDWHKVGYAIKHAAPHQCDGYYLGTEWNRFFLSKIANIRS